MHPLRAAPDSVRDAQRVRFRESLALRSTGPSPHKLGPFHKFHLPLSDPTTQGSLVVAFRRLLLPHSLHGPRFSFSSIPSLSRVGRPVRESGLETLAGSESSPPSFATARMTTLLQRCRGCSCFVLKALKGRPCRWLALPPFHRHRLRIYICAILRSSYLHDAAELSMAMAVLLSW